MPQCDHMQEAVCLHTCNGQNYVYIYIHMYVNDYYKTCAIGYGAIRTSQNVNSVSRVELKITMYVTMCMCMCCGNHVINVHKNKVQCTLD